MLITLFRATAYGAFLPLRPSPRTGQPPGLLFLFLKGKTLSFNAAFDSVVYDVNRGVLSDVSLL